MKKIMKTLSLLLALLLLPALPVWAEAGDGATVYPRVYADEMPCWNTWKPLVELAGIKSYSLIGMNDNVLADGDAISLYCDTHLEEMDLYDAVYCELTDGEMPSEGQVIVPDSSGRAIGDTLTLTAGDASLDVEICGIFSPDTTIYNQPEELANLLVCQPADFLVLLNPEQTDSISVDEITLEDAALLDDFLSEANDLMEDAGVRLMSEAELEAMSSDQPTAATGAPLVTAFGGTDLYGNPLPEEILEPNGITMVNVWATFCNPCIAEMPGLKALSDEYAEAGKPFRIVGVCLDVTDFSGRVYDDLVETGRLIVEQTGADYLHIIPDTQMFTELMYQISAYPTTFFLNDQGEVLSVYVGSRDEDAWREIIEETLATL